MLARMPASTAARATSSMKKYMSAKATVPRRIISIMASRVPLYTCSAFSRSSMGKIRCSQSMRLRSLPTPRSSVMAAWQWAL
jgi:hypothetical protein